MKRHSSNTLAYTAGIMDGEGSISLIRKKTIKINRSGQTLALQISVVNTNEWLCNWLHFQFGGSVGIHALGTEKHKRSFRWQITNRKAYSFLTLILPYLQMKHPQAELALQFQRRRTRANHTEQQTVLDEADKILMTKYNKKGPVEDMGLYGGE